MPYNIFTEKEISAAINKKAPIEDFERGKHDSGKLVVDGYFFSRIKIPNPHKKAFNQGKAKNLAKQLQLSKEEYNEFIKCTLKKKEYEEVLRELIPKEDT